MDADVERGGAREAEYGEDGYDTVGRKGALQPAEVPRCNDRIYAPYRAHGQGLAQQTPLGNEHRGKALRRAI